MNLMELPLVLFTILSQVAIGLVLLSAARQWATVDAPGPKARVEWGAIGAILALGVIASLFHLGQPLGAVRSLTNLKTAWLSREILGIILLGLLVAAVFVGLLRNWASGWLIKLAALIGLLTLIATGLTYAPPSLPAVNGGLSIVFFTLTALVLGAAGASYFAPAHKQPLLTAVLAGSLLVALVVYLLVPWLWLYGGTVQRLTGQAYLASPLYWTRLIIGLVIPLLVLWKMKGIPAWLPVLLLTGELLGRIMFFSLTVSTAANIGGLY